MKTRVLYALCLPIPLISFKEYAKEHCTTEVACIGIRNQSQKTTELEI